MSTIFGPGVTDIFGPTEVCQVLRRSVDRVEAGARLSGCPPQGT